MISASTIVRIIFAALFALVPLVALGQQMSPLPAPLAPDETTIHAQMDALLDARVAQLMAQMDVADKVGQLFIINFAGNDTSFDSDIAPLIHAYRIGGVVISPRYGNFDNAHGTNTPYAVAGLTNRLQALAYGKLLSADASLPLTTTVQALVEDLPDLADVSAVADRMPVNIPLFVAVEQTGDSIENTYLRRNFTTLPTQMALGATWNPDLTHQVGAIVGRELKAVGVNLLMGPNLDVLAQPRPDSVGRLGVDMYGGDSFWVGQMGVAYIDGVHQGSGNRVLTVARHFPGQGDVDRLPDQEVATIQTDLDELRSTAFAPFHRVTQADTNGDLHSRTTDALMPSNMRYSAIQGTGPQRIPPFSLSLDLDTVIQQEGFAEWRDRGLVMSNALGMAAIRRYYAAESDEFPARVVAGNALLVGNDLLYLGSFSEDGTWETERVNIEATVTFFQDRYAADADFADAVDQSVARILRAKLRLFTDPTELRQDALAVLSAGSEAGQPMTTAVGVQELAELPAVVDSAPPVPLDDVLVTADDLALFDPGSPEAIHAAGVVRQVARSAVTALYPDITAPAESLPPAPGEDAQILIFTDSRLQRECATCIAQVAVGPDDLSKIILRLYGPDATDQVSPDQIVNRTFTELAELLEVEPEPTATPVARAAEATPTVAVTPVVPLAPTALTPEAGSLETLPDDADVAGAGASSESPLDREIAEADWIIFNMLDVDTETYPASDAVKRFLRERGAQLNGKQVIVLALNAPYFLDATEISHLSAYLGVYAKSQPFLENAVRVLFRSFPPTGAPPVSVPGTRFADLAQRLQADPQRPLPLELFDGDTSLGADSTDTGPADVPVVEIGSTVRIQVGPVVDRNNHVVPDGTKVDFQVIYEGAELALSVRSAETRDGFVLREVPFERSGLVRIVATSGDATSQPPRLINVADPAVAAPQPVVPQNTVATEVLTDTDLVTAAGELPRVDAVAQPNVAQSTRRVNLATLLVAIFTMLITLSMLLIVQVRILPRAMLVHNLLWAVIVGLSAYIAYGVGLLPGGNWLYGQLDVWSAALVMFMGMIAPMLWLQLRSLRD